MEAKKTDKANLENKKGIFLQIGLVLALAIVLYAFEMKSDVKVAEVVETNAIMVADEEIIPVTQQQKPATPPPPAPKITDFLDVVDDDVQLEDELEIEDAEDETANTTIGDDVNFGDYGSESTGEETIFQVAEDMPIPFTKNIPKWISKRTNYPQTAIENNITGTVVVRFVIERDGSVANPTILKGVDPLLDKEAIRVVGLMPKWTPGKQRGNPVRVYYQIPVVFRLNN